MKNLMFGAAMIGLGASVALGGCSQDDDTPVTDEVTRAEAERGVAPRVDRFASGVGDHAPASALISHGALAAGEDPGVVTVIRAQFDPAVFRDAAAFRAKLEVK